MPAEIASGIERVTVRTVAEAAADHEASGRAPILCKTDQATANSARARSACLWLFCSRNALGVPRGLQTGQQAFGPSILQRLHGRIEQVADQILDRGKSRGEIELISECASVIPTASIPELLGLPIGDSSKFRALLSILLRSTCSTRRLEAMALLIC